MRVIIVPPTQAARDILLALSSWSRSGLLRPFCWWCASGPNGDGPSLLVERVERGEMREVVLSKLPDRDTGSLEIVACYPLLHGESVHLDFVQDVDSRVAAATDVLAFTQERPAECTMIVIPSEICQPIPDGIFLGRWAASVYVAPEDRSSPSGASRLPQNEAAFVPHAAHALATLSDLWIPSGISTQPVIERLPVRHTGELTAPVRVARCFSRVVDFGHLADRLATTVFRSGSAWPNPDLTMFDRVSDPSRIIRPLLGSFLQKHQETLGLSEFTAIEIAELPPLGLIEALRLLFSEWFWRIKREPFVRAERLAENLYKQAASTIGRLAGPDSDIRVRGIRPWRSLSDGFVELRRLSAEVRDCPVFDDAPVTGVWSDLRKMAIGLIDGSAMPEGLDERSLKRGAKRAVVTDPRKIVPDPALTPPIVASAVEPLRACDPLHLDPRFAQVKSGQEAARNGLDGVGGEDMEELSSWCHAHESTPLWMTGVTIASALRVAERESHEVESGDEQDMTRTRERARQEAIELQQRGRKHMRVWAGSSFVLASIAVYLSVSLLSVFACVGAIIVILVIWMLILANYARKIVLQEELSELEPLRQEVAFLNRTMLRALRASDEFRLQRRYQEYLDWAEIIGWAAHHPWVGSQVDQDFVVGSGDSIEFPAGCAIAVARTSEQLTELGEQARNELFHTSWLTGVYAATENSLRGRRRGSGNRIGLSMPESPNPAGDNWDDPESPRRRLCAAFRRGDSRHLGESELARELLKHVERLPLDSIAEYVIPAPDDITRDESRQSPAQFSPDRTRPGDEESWGVPVAAAAPATDGLPLLGSDQNTEQDQIESRVNYTAILSSANPDDSVALSRFIGELTADVNEHPFLPRHWRGTDNDEHLVDHSILDPASSIDTTASVGDLVGKVIYHESVRIMLHRIDLARPIAAVELRSCSQNS